MDSDESKSPAGGADPPFTRSPNLVPQEVLRDFMADQARVHGYRALADRVGTGHETLRKFVTGRTVQPHPRQRELMGAEFLQVHPSGYVREATVDGRPRALGPLKMLLPPEREQAEEVLDRIFALAERHPDELPGQAAAVRAWMRRVLEAEFDADMRYPPGQRPPGPSGVRDR
ncbi:hypothetical protein [Longimicrobium sp.]|uniref:hypothetical protein n=1 Tax=Longimicrobium sp. TaxID=2029185 RepID=UPI003B3AF2C1